MSLAPEDIEKIAQLSKLNLSNSETEQFTKQLDNIIKLVEQMNSVNTDQVTAMCHSLDLSQRLRSDEVTEIDQRAAYQKIAPLTSAGLYLVPQVIETV